MINRRVDTWRCKIHRGVAVPRCMIHREVASNYLAHMETQKVIRLFFLKTLLHIFKAMHVITFSVSIGGK